jgi:hypothetical protein
MAFGDQPARVQLGCGTLILIVLLVLLITSLFGGDGRRDEDLREIRADLRALREEVRDLRAELRVATPASPRTSDQP